MKAIILLRRAMIPLFLSLWIPSILNGQINQPRLQIPLIKSAPVIDGKLDDTSWQKSTELTEFVNWTLNSYIKDPVSVYLCYDEKNLYVAFKNSDPDAQILTKSVSPKGPRDTFLWGRNHISVSIGNKDISLRLMADPKETMTDWKNEDISWNGNWEYSASVNEADWTAEFSIPLEEAGLKVTSSGEVIDLSLSRSYPLGESSGWSGKCTLSGESSVIFQYGRWPSPVPRNNQIPFIAQNFGKSPANLICELELIPLNGEPEFINQAGQGPSSDLQIKASSPTLYYSTRAVIPAGGSVKQNISYNLPREGSYYASVIVKSADGKILRRSVDYWFTIESNRKNIAGLMARTGEAIATMTRVSNPVANRLKADADNLLAEVQDLENKSETFWNSDRWNEMTKNVEVTDKKVSRLLHEVRWTALHNWNSNFDFGISLTHSIIKLRRDALFPGQLSEHAELSLARNEYESFQLAILPFGKDLNHVTLWISDLTGIDGKMIPASNIEVSLVNYNKIEWQADYVAKKGWHPDPLIPVKEGFNISGEDICRPLWVTVYAPTGTKPGEYTGRISVSADGMKKVAASVKCRIRDFDLPVVSHLKTHSWDQIEYFKDFYNMEKFPIEWYQRFCGLLLKNRFNPGSAGVNYLSRTPDSTGSYDFTNVGKVLEYCIERGLTRFSMIQMKKGLYTPEEAEKAYKFIEAYAKFLKQKGWLDKALVELWDEPTDLEWPYIKERAERIKKIDPDIRLQLFAEGGPYDFFDRNTDQYGLNSLVDIWAPVNIIESPETQAMDREIWTYFCTLARESAPNFFIDCPAICQRSIAWYCWMYGVDGFEHWSSNYFWRNVKEGKPMDQKWPYVPWDSRTYYYFNGEGQLVYPGPDGVPYSSIRLENFRDGMEDYEYLFRLRELLAKYKDNTTDERINEYRQLLNPEEYLLYKYPRKIRVTLENTLRYPDQPEMIVESRNRIANAIEELQKRL